MKKWWTACAAAAMILSGGAALAGDVDEVPAARPATHMEMVLVLDKSGSMSGLEDDTIGGFNSMIEKQKEDDIDANVTTVLFSDEYKMLYNRRKLADVANMTEKDYTPGGMTALLDAVGRTINKMDVVPGIHKKDTKVLFVIITDGKENYSKEYNKKQIQKMIKERQEEGGWEFVFLGANIDAVDEAESIGISADRAMKYKNTKSGVRANFAAISAMSKEMSTVGSVGESWKGEVEEDKEQEEQKK